MFILVLAITGVILVVVEGVLIYSIVRFRRKAGETTEPPQVYGSMPIEIAWTAAPALTAFVLALILTRTEFEIRRDPKSPPEGAKPLHVTVIGHQWWWEFVYDRYDDQDLGFITANELHVPASDVRVPRPVYLTLESADVCHSFWVPRLAGKTDLIPGRTNQMWFQTNRARLVPRPVRRVLRHPARQHAAQGQRRFAGRIPGVARKPETPGGQRSRSTCRPGCILVAVVRELPPRERHERPRNLRSRSHALDEQADDRRRDDAEYAARAPEMADQSASTPRKVA